MILRSLEALRKEFKLAPVEKREKELKCRKCGSPLRKIADSNVYMCDNVIKEKSGKERPCGYSYIKHNA